MLARKKIKKALSAYKKEVEGIKKSREASIKIKTGRY